MIHASAIVDPSATLAADCEVGPYTVIGPGVTIGAGCRIGPHVVMKGPTTIGARNRIYQFASVGEDPQDLKYAGEPTELVVGDERLLAVRKNPTREELIRREMADSLDTNVLVCRLHSEDEPKRSIARELLLGDIVIGVQVLNELTNVGSVRRRESMNRHRRAIEPEDHPSRSRSAQK